MRNRVLSDTGESIFSVVSRRARETGAVDLGQGYPAYSPPEGLTRALRDVEPTADNHQYAHPHGRPELRERLAVLYEEIHGIDYDHKREITVTSGATEAINAALMGLVNSGDEVVVLEPIYDQYVPVARRAGAEVTVLRLRPDDYGLPVENLEAAVDDSTDLVLINNPHNPTGSVFARESLQALVDIARRHDVTLLSDEVYEHLVFEDEVHSPLAGIDGARERTLTFASAGKSFDATGWKIGWALGPPDLMESLRLAHQFTTYCSATPLQGALETFLRDRSYESFFAGMREQYAERRHLLIDALERSPLEPLPMKGSYFLPARVRDREQTPENPEEAVDWLIDRFGVAAVPMSAFFTSGSGGEDDYRFAFCKDRSTLERAGERLTGES